MPTERFLNLPAPKRQRIVNATLQELERVPYDEISINKIIKAARIPRGSFYQYFNDKDDLLFYVTGGYMEGVLAVVGERLAATHGDLFDAIRAVFDYTVEYGLAEENLAVCKNIFASHKMHQQTTRQIVDMLTTQGLLAEYLPLISLERFRYAEAGDMRDILEMLIVLFRDATIQLFSDVGRLDEIRQGFYNKLKILWNGILKESENTANV